MTIDNQALVLDLVEWVAEAPRTYAEVMAAWRTSCPRLTIWEDALDLSFVRRQMGPNGKTLVTVTEEGRAFLAAHGRVCCAANQPVNRSLERRES